MRHARHALTALLASLVALHAAAQSTRLPQDEVIYQIMPIAWRDSNNDSTGGVSSRYGDFGGLAATESLDYLQYLGVTMVYLQPIFPSPAYHGYQHGPADQLNPIFGTQAQFQAFVNAAHARGMKVILDFVAYGISHNSPYYQSAFGNPSSVYDTWLAFTNAANTTYVGYTFNTWNGSQVGFIHWNLDHPSAVATVTNWAAKWLDPNADGDTSDGVDGFRLDHAWASGGEGWGANIAFWETWCSALRAVKPGIFIFCEPSDWGNYGADLMTLDGFDAVLTKPWEFSARSAVTSRNAADLYAKTAATVAAVPAGKVVVAQTNDHDSDRLASAFSSSNNNTVNARQKVAAAILFTQPFPPNIYYGDEIGMRGSKAATGTDADDIPMREPFKWKAVAGAPMSNYPAVTVGTKPPTFSANNDGRSVEEQKGVAGSVLETYRSLIAVRKGSVALRRGAYLPITCPDAGVFAFLRHDPAEAVLVAINLNSGSTSTSLDLSGFTVPSAGTLPVSLENGAMFQAITGSNQSAYPITLPGRGWMIARASLTPPPSTSTPDVDGRDIVSNAGGAPARGVQTCLSSFGDNVGELNQMFVWADGEAIRVSLTGNLPSDTSPILLFVDVDPGAATGQSRLATAHLPSPPATLAPLDGTTFDAGFSPDALYHVNTTGGLIYVDRVTLPGSGLAVKDYRGSVGLGSGRGVLTGGSNPAGIEVAMDNSNTTGITGTSVASAGTATRGLEMRLPLAELGLPAGFSGSISVSACLGQTTGALSNQWLPGLEAGSANLGMAPDLRSVPGAQFTSVTLGLQGDLDGNGTVDAGDIGSLLLLFGPCNGCAADLDGSGEVDAGDIGSLLLLFN
ncbi:MAG: hypothetical protein EBQ99_07815 [Planctomycetes bacterium]|nr:hypothetical protein [Planctomycetota bacterium]